MGKIEELILRILESNSIDEKTKFGKEAVELFKNLDSEFIIPIAIRLNLSVRLKDAIDNFIIQDNLTSRETLRDFFLSNNLYLQEAS
ncbi:hypothetical protein [Pseudofulvibacter geojedonensis]|uniref:Uncharacterized protein n=1 Tax=Pseudofulvibacter geojedonensis TaxID=1123758 RepID=A0ABW3I4E5_9FLAO